MVRGMGVEVTVGGRMGWGVVGGLTGGGWSGWGGWWWLFLVKKRAEERLVAGGCCVGKGTTENIFVVLGWVRVGGK